MLHKNEEYIGVVENMGMNGEGVIKNDDTTVFVPFAITGEKIKYRVLKVNGKIAYGKIMEVFTPAEERVRPRCPVFGKCGGCDLQHIKYPEQLKIKQQKIKTCFKKIAGIDVDVLPVVKGGEEYRYRNKFQIPVGETNEGTQIGFYATNSHRIVPITDCVINPEWSANLITVLQKYMQENSLKGYNDFTCTGDIREITAKEVDGYMIIALVITGNSLPNIDRFIEILKEELKRKFSLYLNINNSKNNVIFGDEFKLVYGCPSFESEMLGITYRVGVQSFMQVNTAVCYKLYSSVVSEIDADEKTTVIDAYSGAGLMTALLAKKAKKAIGIEVVKEAALLAEELASANGLRDKITVYNDKCEDVLPKIILEERENGSKIALVLDPPRKGCELEVVKAIIDSDIDKLVYVSCKPSTLARDIGLIVGTLTEENGEIKKAENSKLRYRIEKIEPYEMFPQTKHIETLCVLKKI